MIPFEENIVASPRPRHEDAGGVQLSDDIKANLRHFADKAVVGLHSIAIPIPEGADQLRYVNRITGYCNTIGGPGWSKARNQMNGTARVWKIATPDIDKLISKL